MGGAGGAVAGNESLKIAISKPHKCEKIEGNTGTKIVIYQNAYVSGSIHAKPRQFGRLGARGVSLISRWCEFDFASDFPSETALGQ